MSAARRVVQAICVLNGVSAAACGFFMMAGAADALPASLEGAFASFNGMVPLVQRLPLPSFMAANLFWPGLALVLVNGVANLVAVAWFAMHDRRARGWALAAGLLLIGWCAFELAFMANPVSAAYLVVGLVQTACAWKMPPTGGERSPSRAA